MISPPHASVSPPGRAAASLVASDVLWSDPALKDGLEENVQRGIGCIFGPDITEVRGCAAAWRGAPARLLARGSAVVHLNE